MPSEGRYDAPPFPPWLLVCRDASFDADGVLNLREVVRAIGLPSMPALVFLALVYEIPFHAAPRDVELRFQIQQPDGRDLQGWVPGTTLTMVNTSVGTARRITLVPELRLDQIGWHAFRVLGGPEQRVLAESFVKVVIGRPRADE